MKAVVLCHGGLASAVLAFLLGKEDRGQSRNSLPPLSSALREQLGLAPEGYALHLLTSGDGQPLSSQRRYAARLIAALLDASYEVLDPAALSWLPAPVSTSPVARLFTLAGIVAVRQEAAVIAAGIRTSEPAFVARFNQIAERMGKATELPRLQLLTPLAGSSLADLITLGDHLGIPPGGHLVVFHRLRAPVWLLCDLCGPSGGLSPGGGAGSNPLPRTCRC